MLDVIKDLGFRYATRAGISIGIDDLCIPRGKEKLVRSAHEEVLDIEQFHDGAITDDERHDKVIVIWSNVTEKVADAMFEQMEKQEEAGGFNPIRGWCSSSPPHRGRCTCRSSGHTSLRHSPCRRKGRYRLLHHQRAHRLR